MSLDIKGTIALTDANVKLNKFNKPIIQHKFLDGNTQGFLMVGAGWCGHCHVFIPEYQKVAASTSTAFPCFLLTDKNKKAVSMLKIDGFPSLYWINSDGTLTPYLGERSSLPILDQICKRSRVCNFRS